jgi:hypothetical protein
MQGLLFCALHVLFCVVILEATVYITTADAGKFVISPQCQEHPSQKLIDLEQMHATSYRIVTPKQIFIGYGVRSRNREGGRSGGVMRLPRDRHLVVGRPVRIPDAYASGAPSARAHVCGRVYAGRFARGCPGSGPRVPLVTMRYIRGTRLDY